MTRLGGIKGLKEHVMFTSSTGSHEIFDPVKYTSANIDFPIFRCKGCYWGALSEIASDVLVGANLDNSFRKHVIKEHGSVKAYPFLARENLKEGGRS